jgi:hypothetical protein
MRYAECRCGECRGANPKPHFLFEKLHLRPIQTSNFAVHFRTYRVETHFKIERVNEPYHGSQR